MNGSRAFVAVLSLLACFVPVAALEKPDVTYKIFQFPADRIPRVDGNADDWAMVPEHDLAGAAARNQSGSGLRFNPDGPTVQRVKLYRYR
jgi:hypothetical protein